MRTTPTTAPISSPEPVSPPPPSSLSAALLCRSSFSAAPALLVDLGLPVATLAGTLATVCFGTVVVASTAGLPSSAAVVAAVAIIASTSSVAGKLVDVAKGGTMVANGLGVRLGVLLGVTLAVTFVVGLVVAVGATDDVVWIGFPVAPAGKRRTRQWGGIQRRAI